MLISTPIISVKLISMGLTLIKYLFSFYIICLSSITFAEVRPLHFDDQDITVLSGDWKFYPKQLEPRFK